MAPATLASLPSELVQQIQSLLPYPSRLALRLTNRALYLTSAHPGSSYTMADLLIIETWPCYNGAASREMHLKQAIAGQDFFACGKCRQIRSALHFSNNMMKEKRGKTSAHKGNKAGRFCIACGIKTGQYHKGVSFRYGGAHVFGVAEHRGIVCPYCDEFHSGYGACPKYSRNKRGEEILANPKMYTYI